MKEDIISLRKMQVVSWVFLVVITAVTWVVVSFTFAWSVFAGGVISILSFIVSSRDVVAFFNALSQDNDGEDGTRKVKKKKTGFIIKFWFRIAVIGITLLLLIKSGQANIFGLILGLSTVVFAVTFTALSVTRRYFYSRRR